MADASRIIQTSETGLRIIRRREGNERAIYELVDADGGWHASSFDLGVIELIAEFAESAEGVAA